MQKYNYNKNHYGVAIEVPEMVLYDVSLVFQAE